MRSTTLPPKDARLGGPRFACLYGGIVRSRRARRYGGTCTGKIDEERGAPLSEELHHDSSEEGPYEGAFDADDAQGASDEDVIEGRFGQEAPKRSIGRFAMRQVNRARKLVLCGEGFSLRGARTWISRSTADWRHHEAAPSDIHRAHKAGFTAHQVERFGVDMENPEQSLSEYEYDLLFPISGRYAKWIDDRVTAAVVAGPLVGLLETAHVNIISRNGELLFIPLSDEAKAFAVSPEAEVTEERGIAWFQEFVRAHEHDGLKITGSAWSSRIYLPIKRSRRGYVVDDASIGPDAFFELVRHYADNTPLVVVGQAPEDESLSARDTGLSCSVRLTVCNPSGNDPQVVDAFLRMMDPRLDDEAEAAMDPEELDARVRYYAAHIDLADGSFSGARAMFGRGRFVDTPCHLETGVLFTGAVPHWEAIKRDVVALARRVPQIELMELGVRSGTEGYRIVRMSSFPSFNRAYPLPVDVQLYLKQRAVDKRELLRPQARERVGHAAFLRLRRAYTQLLFPAGMVYYQGIRYPHDVLEDLVSNNGIPLKKKLWAYRHGFLSYRLELYPELDEDNWQEFVTDFEYRWLRHINPKYRTWMEDKVSYKYLLADHSEFLPAYYFYTSCRAGENRFLPMMDCPPAYEASVGSILRLAREEGELALKPDEGSHGEGFYRLSYQDEVYLLNGEPATEEHVDELLTDPDNQYLVTECVETHPELRRIYPGAVGTVRVTVFKRDGVNPTIGNAYLRIGSSSTGGVDNVVAGGFVAEVDVATGAFGRARTLCNNRIVYVDVHPDTGERMEGVLPHWDFVCEKVLELARDIPQLEYLGFDVAITEDGFKLLEVNRYPDYPRISRLTPETTSYLLKKIEDKKRYLDIEHDHSLFKLPERSTGSEGDAR